MRAPVDRIGLGEQPEFELRRHFRDGGEHFIDVICLGIVYPGTASEFAVVEPIVAPAFGRLEHFLRKNLTGGSAKIRQVIGAIENRREPTER